MKDEALERIHEFLDRVDVVARRFVVFVTRPWAVRKLFWRERRKRWKQARKELAYLREYEATFWTALQLVETFPDLIRSGSEPIRLSAGVGYLRGVLISAKIEESFEELAPAVVWLAERGYSIQKYDDKTKYLRRYRLKLDGRTRGYLLVNVGAGAKCDVIEKKVETTEYEIVCEGEKALRGEA